MSINLCITFLTLKYVVFIELVFHLQSEPCEIWWLFSYRTKKVSHFCNDCNGHNLKLRNKHESQWYRIKAAENEKKSRFLHISLPFPRFKDKTEGVSVVWQPERQLWTRLEWCKHFLKSQRLQFCSTKNNY